MKHSEHFAHIVSVAGCQAVAVVNTGDFAPVANQQRIEIGALLKIPTPTSSVIGLVSAVSKPLPNGSNDSESEICLIELNLAGEIVADADTGKQKFSRGVANFPSVGDAVLFADYDDLTRVYVQPDCVTIDIGTLYQDASVPACLRVDDLFGKHFIIVGTTGCGKSSALVCVLQQVLATHEHAHIVILDVHSEYAAAFGDRAELINTGNLRLPFWLLNFQELTTAFTSNDGNHDAEVEIPGDAVLSAKRSYSESQSGRLRRYGEAAGVTVETPTPFRLSDVVSYINDQLGRLERVQSIAPYRRLKSRIEALISDPRYSFMFGSLTVEDTMVDILGHIFRIPSDGKPITVIDLAAVPSEILDVVISLISRLAFDLAVWSEGGIPLLLVCEEAHRYAPARKDGGFLPTRQALARIAKEGRKYGVSLALITQRPSELDSAILSQCNTVIAMRLTTDRDQQVMRANAHDGALNLMDFLPLLGDREAIVIGQGVPMPMRIRFRDITSTGVPRDRSRGFSTSWAHPNMDQKALEESVARWRSATRGRSEGTLGRG